MPAPAHAALGGGLVVRIETASLFAASLPGAFTRGDESERVFEQFPALVRVSGKRAHAVESVQRELGRDFRVVCDERGVVGVDGSELVAQAFRVLEGQARLFSSDGAGLGTEALLPEPESLVGGHAPTNRVHHSCPCLPAACSRVLEEGDVAARASVLVGVEEVVHRRVVLVDRLLDEAEAENAGVEVDVLGRIPGDAGDVVDAFQAHACQPRASAAAAKRRPLGVSRERNPR